MAAHEIVNVAVLAVVGWHEHGEMETAGHLQFMAVSDEKGVEFGSLHVALTTNADRVESEMSHPSPPHPIVAPQSNGSAILILKHWCKERKSMQIIDL